MLCSCNIVDLDFSFIILRFIKTESEIIQNWIKLILHQKVIQFQISMNDVLIMKNLN